MHGRTLGDRLRGLEWEKLVESERVVSRDMEVFYPQHRFLNFYVVPLSLEAPQDEAGARSWSRRWSVTQ